MKIGILTFHNAYNYGAVLQTYATQQILKLRGVSVEIIDYRNEAIENSYRTYRLRNVRTPIEFTIQIIISYFRKRKAKRFHEFTNKYLCLSRFQVTKYDNKIDGYNKIFIGSDQVWNPKLTGGFDKFYWGNFFFPKTTKLIAWAASSKEKSIKATDKYRITSYLENFSNISVREEKLKRYLLPLTSKDISILLDPTFLLDRQEWIKLCYPIKKKKYILVYALQNEKEVIMIARKLSATKKLSLIVVNPLCNAKIRTWYKQSWGPLDFLSYVNGAEYIIASSFHGTAFSIIFQKQFFCYIEKGQTNVRVQSILNSLNIHDRIISRYEDILLEQAIDYNVVNKNLRLLKQDSFTFINSVL